MNNICYSSWLLKWNVWEKAFSSGKTKTNPNFAVKLAERSNHSFLLSIWWIRFFKHLCSVIRVMECIELHWLCKHMKQVRSSQAAIVVLNWAKHGFSLWVSLIIINFFSLITLLYWKEGSTFFNKKLRNTKTCIKNIFNINVYFYP